MAFIKTSLNIILGLLLLLSLSYSVAGEFAISPMLIEISTTPGSKEVFEFHIFGKKSGKVKVSPFSMRQQPTGHMAFVDLTGKVEETADWLDLSDSLIDVKENEDYTITGTLTIPRKAAGNHLLALMVEEVKGERNKGVSLSVRYAIVVNINIIGKKSRIKGSFSDLVIEEQEGKYFVSGWFESLSTQDAALNSIAYIRNESKKLVGKIPLRTQSAWQRGDYESRIFPKAKVKVYGPIDKSLHSALYTLSARNRFGGKMQPMYRANPKMYVFNQEKQEKITTSIAIAPNPLPLKVNKRGQSFSALQLKNTYGKPVTLTLPKHKDESPIEFKFIPNVVNLNPSASKMIVLKEKFTDGVAKSSTYKIKVEGENINDWIELKTIL